MGAQSKIDLATAEKYLAQFRAKPVAHLIDGKPDTEGTLFETQSPVDHAVLAQVHAGTPSVIDRAAKSSAQAFKSWGKTSGDKRRAILHKIADAHRGARRRDRRRRMHGYRPADPLHEQGGVARCGELPVLRRPRAGSRRWRVSTHGASCELHDAPADRSRGRHNALEHALHVIDLEDRAGFGLGLHGRPQAGRMEPVDRLPAGGDRAGSRAAARRFERRPRFRRNRRQAADRTPGHQGGGLCRGEHHRQPYHGPRRANAETHPFRTGRQEPGSSCSRTPISTAPSTPSSS